MSDQRDDAGQSGRSQESAEEKKRSSLPPGADTRGATEEIHGNAGREAPYEEAPAEGHLAPDAVGDATGG